MIKLQANRLLASDLELQTSEYLIVNYLIGESKPQAPNSAPVNRFFQLFAIEIKSIYDYFSLGIKRIALLEFLFYKN